MTAPLRAALERTALLFLANICLFTALYTAAQVGA